MDIAIEQATAADLSAVLDLTMEHARLNEGFDRGYYSLADSAENEYGDALRASLRDKNQVILVAKAGEEVVGCVQADVRKIPIFRRGTRGLIFNLYVKRMWRRRGIGTRLMAEATNWLQDRGAEIIFLNVASQNSEAQQFYDKLGFKIVNANMYRIL